MSSNNQTFTVTSTNGNHSITLPVLDGWNVESTFKVADFYVLEPRQQRKDPDAASQARDWYRDYESLGCGIY